MNYFNQINMVWKNNLHCTVLFRAALKKLSHAGWSPLFGFWSEEALEKEREEEGI